MDAAHLHMEIQNRRDDSEEIYWRCVRALDAARLLPGQEHDQGERCGIGTALGLGEIVKDVIREHAKAEHGVDFDGNTLTETLYCTFVGHISTEALGDAFYTSTRQRYAG